MKQNHNKVVKSHCRFFLSILAVLIISGASQTLDAATLITNGDLELWNGTSGTPPQGTPTGWSGAGSVIRSGGLVSGSTYSGVIQAGQSGLYYNPLQASASNFQIDFVMATTDPGASGRSFNLLLAQSSGSVINFRAVEGSSGSGFVTLQAYSTSFGWVNLVQNLSASVYTGGSTNAFTTLNAYNIQLVVDFGGAPSYSLSYGLVGSSMTTLSNLTYFSATPVVGEALTSIGFSGANSASNYGIDNVIAVSIPEPQTTALVCLSAMVFLVLRKRKIFSTVRMV